MSTEEVAPENDWHRGVEERFAGILQPVFSSDGETSWFQIACALLRVSAVTCQPARDKMAVASIPTAPLAPLTATGPAAGVKPACTRGFLLT